MTHWYIVYALSSPGGGIPSIGACVSTIHPLLKLSEWRKIYEPRYQEVVLLSWKRMEDDDVAAAIAAGFENEGGSPGNLDLLDTIIGSPLGATA